MKKVASHQKIEPLAMDFKYLNEQYTARANIELDGELIYSKLSFSKFPEANLFGARDAITGEYAWDISTVKHPLRAKAKHFGACILKHLKKNQVL